MIVFIHQHETVKVGCDDIKECGHLGIELALFLLGRRYAQLPVFARGIQETRSEEEVSDARYSGHAGRGAGALFEKAREEVLELVRGRVEPEPHRVESGRTGRLP